MKHAKIRTILGVLVCTATLAALAYQSWARTTVVVVVQGAAAAGNAANQVLDPVSTNATGDWVNSDDDQLNLHTYIDDGATADDLTWVKSDTANYAIFNFSSVTGTINTVRLHIRAMCYSTTANNETISVSADGTTWRTDVDIALLTASYADYTKDFTSLSWNGASTLRVRIAGNTSFSEQIRISRLRLEINP